MDTKEILDKKEFIEYISSQLKINQNKRTEGIRWGESVVLNRVYATV